MDKQHFRTLVDRFNQARVLVVGDIYLDENTFGVMTGISLEAPVPIFEVQERRHNPGAAGNAACNVAALGAKTFMVGVVGADPNADIVRKEFAVRNVDTSRVVVDPQRPTNTYGKLRAGSFNAPSQEVLRTDTPRPIFISSSVEQEVIANIHALAGEVDAIVVVDQVSAVATERVLAAVVACAKQHKILTVGDSRERAGAFKDFDIIVPNDREAGVGAGITVDDDASLRQAGKTLLKICRNALITRGPQGITIFAENGDITDVPITPRDVVDVTGAGDTVTAAVAVTVVSGGSLHDAAVVGNTAAGIAVMCRGVVTVPKAELEHALFDEEKAGPGKLKTLDELRPILEALKRDGKTIVWTNGCFDILHIGHITYLQKAAREGHILVVGLNSDESVKRVKGPSRPVIPEAHRAAVLSALECVDFVTIFGEPTTVAILKDLQPDVYAKGGDYTIDTIVQEERKIIEGYGGRIALLPGVEGQSTTAIIGRIAE